MKRKLPILLTSLASLVVLAPSTALAQIPTEPLTNVSGVVTYDGVLVPDANVTVECNKQIREDITNSQGTYLVSFHGVQCPMNTAVNVIAKKDQRGGYSSGHVTALTTKLNVALINVSIPEFGTIAGVGAAFTAGGAFLLNRRRTARNIE